MKNRLILTTFTLIAIVFYSCGDSSANSPEEQNNFTKEWRDYKEKYTSADTDAKKSHWRSEGKKHLNQKDGVSNWFGKVEEVGSNYITVKHQGIKYYLYPKGDAVNYLDFDKNMSLYFSGILNGLYFWDNLTDPGIYVDCMSIYGEDKIKAYFVISDSEMKKYKADKKLDQEFYDALEDGFNDIMNEFEKSIEK